MESKRVPEVRFEGFSGDWEERKLSYLMEFSNGINAPKENYGKGRKMVSVMDILANEPIIYKNIRNSVEVDDKTESKNKVENGDLVFVRSSEIRDEVGWAKAYQQDEYALYSGFSIRGKKKNNFDAKFIELTLNNANREQIERKAGGSTRFNVSQSILEDIVILEPTINEQIALGDFFKQLDDMIALHQQELTTLKQTKQGFLQKMFPKKGESVPEIRFPGFTEDWEERKFFDSIKNIIDFRGRTPKKLGLEWSNSGYLALSALNVKNGYIDPTADAHYGDEELYQKWMGERKLKQGQVLFTTEAPMGNVAQVPDNKGYILSQRTIAFDIDENKITNDFLSVLLGSPKVFNELSSLSSGGTAKGVSQKSLSQLNVNVPKSLKEQTKIGTFFKQLDDSIALHQRELDALKETKKAFLQKMFV
ncbi:restriction endonuclease subunit S [Bacillus vallismortis]|nr:restriction endonuclease subunit S [Bacillus vallismortis]